MERVPLGLKDRFALVPKHLWEITSHIKEQSKLIPLDFLRRHEISTRSVFPGSIARAREEMAIPVMICARNEKENIGRTLYGLSRSEVPVQPLVVDNVSNDGTGDFARRLGSEVIREERPGLLNALRRGFTYFRDIDYRGPILLTDADTVPLPTWAGTMVSHAQNAIPDGGEAFGRVFHYDYDGESHIIKNAILSTGSNMLDFRAAKRGEPRAHGPNGVIMIDRDGYILGNLSRLNDSLPDGYGTDVAVLRAIKSTGGIISFCNDSRALVVTSGRRYPSIQDVIGLSLNRKKIKDKAYRNWGEVKS